jgi:phosphomannomutase/phosphoglucomutase
MKEKNAVFGGEENGGLIFPEIQYCRDSSMSFTKMLEILAKEKRSLSELIAEIPSYEIYKTKITCSNEKKERVMDLVVEHAKNNKDVRSIDRTDGVKLYVKGGWVLMRPSGTEPIFRLFVEAKEKQRAEQLVKIYKKLLESLLEHV